MKCPYCGQENLSGADDCESCSENLSSLDGVMTPKTKISKTLMEDPVAKLNPREATLIDGRETVLAAVRKMNRDKVGYTLVTKNGVLVGILTERDIVFKILAKKKKPADVRVESVMTPNPVMLDEEDTLAYALNRMAVGGCRHVPILREGRPAGIVSVRDILKYLAKLFPETSGR